MTNEIEELEALLEKATPGPWTVERDEDGAHYKNGAYIIMAEGDCEHHAIADFSCNHTCRPDYECEDNADFTAAARNLLPTLLQSLKDKDAEIERLQETYDAALRDQKGAYE